MNTPKVILNDLLAKEMTRQDFLKFSGAAILGVVGVTGFLQNAQKLTGAQLAGVGGGAGALGLGQQTTGFSSTLKGYGNAPYGI